MNRKKPLSACDSNEEVDALIETLHQTEHRLENLTAGEVDSVTDSHGRTLLLRRAQDHMRLNEAAKQAAILNALPANIALLDARGRILSVNKAWRRFAGANMLQGPAYGIGVNYIDICVSARGDGATKAHQAAAGIRSVLTGEADNFTLEYPCDSPSEKRWFLMMVAPLADDHSNGAVVMHINITERKAAQDRIVFLNRIFAMLSGINSLIVRVRDRDELFRESCRIANETGGFRMSMIGIMDRSTMQIVPVASAGRDGGLLTGIKNILSSRENAPFTLIALAIKEKKTIVSNDSQNDPRILFNKQYTDFGIHSMAILPLIVSDEAIGVLALYANEIEFFHDEELSLVTELAGDISFAINHIDKQDRLDYLAYYDELTGLANRNLFLERVAQYIRSAVSGEHKLALLMIDLERFKNINDSLGQLGGDDLLKQVAAWLTDNLGEVNLLARMGADHFAVVLPEVTQEVDVARIIKKMMESFQHYPFHLHDAVFRIAMKVGVTLFPDDGASADTLIRNAEAALKKAKAIGERYLFYTQKMTEAMVNKLSLENQLRQAFDKEEFVLHYQPKVNLVSGKLTSTEALIRWNDPRTGLVPPARFIPILEEIGLITDVGRWALHKAIEDYLRWRAVGLAAVRIAVNVSSLQLRNRGFTDEIRKAIDIHEFAPSGLELEITESLIMADIKHSIASLQSIRAMGVSIAIDDFGTGFSSLSYLSKLPVDTLKIDRSFVIEMTETPEGLSLVSTIINLAHSMKLKVVAEGVETEEQSRLLRLLDCDEMQGYLFSKPVPREIFETRFLSPLLPGNQDCV